MRRRNVVTIAILSAILLGLAIGLNAGCHSPVPPQVDAKGAIVKSVSYDEARLRAYAPAIELTLTWEAPGARNFKVLIENMNGPSTRIKSVTLNEQLIDISGDSSDPVVESLDSPPLPNGATGIPLKQLVFKKPAQGTYNLVIEPNATGILEPGATAFKFAVFGDSQGRNSILGKVIEGVNTEDIDFVVHLGDMVPSGKQSEYDAFFETMAQLKCPYYAVPGNHDTRGDGPNIYMQHFGPMEYCFDYMGHRFVFVNSSEAVLTDSQLDWLETVLGEGVPGLIFMHVPALDPRGDDHAFVDQESASRFIDLATTPESRVRAVFSGHIHMFHERHKPVQSTDAEAIIHETADSLQETQQAEPDSGQTAGQPDEQPATSVPEVLPERQVLFATSGGAGAGLYEVPEKGGFHHYVVVEVSDGAVSLEVRNIKAPEQALDLVILGKHPGEIVLTPEELEAMANRESRSSFQNQFGNYRGEGIYGGIPVRDLVELCGGMDEQDELVVYASDGYSQVYAYQNVFPETAGWHDIQGDMILAITMDGQQPPEWGEGYRIVFLPEDEIYDNEDCAKTSVEGQGWNLYASAGARWVKHVARLEVRKCQSK